MSSTTPQEPILASWTISEVLDRYPRLRDVLVGLSPVFGPLRNARVGRVQERLVTVAQAAQIAGMESAVLVQRLNEAIGVTTPSEAGSGVASRTGNSADDGAFEVAPVAVELDVRPILARGEEPFHAIGAAAVQVPEGGVLRLRVPFEPLPLYDVLGKRGFLHRASLLGPGDWEVLFLKVGMAAVSDAERERASEEPAPLAPLSDGPAETLTIDVSDLVPPEPMVRILETLEQLPPGRTLVVHHQRRPVYLYPRLDALGYQHETRDLGPGQVELQIRKPAAVTGQGS